MQITSATTSTSVHSKSSIECHMHSVEKSKSVHSADLWFLLRFYELWLSVNGGTQLSPNVIENQYNYDRAFR